MTVGPAASKGYPSVFELARSVNSVQAAALHRCVPFFGL